MGRYQRLPCGEEAAVSAGFILLVLVVFFVAFVGAMHLLYPEDD